MNHREIVKRNEQRQRFLNKKFQGWLSQAYYSKGFDLMSEPNQFNIMSFLHWLEVRKIDYTLTNGGLGIKVDRLQRIS